MDDEPPGRRCEGALRGPEASRGGPLRTIAGYLRESSGGAVPPRGVQPVPLEHVLGKMRQMRCRVHETGPDMNSCAHGAKHAAPHADRVTRVSELQGLTSLLITQ